MPSQRGDVCGEAAKVKLDRKAMSWLTLHNTLFNIIYIMRTVRSVYSGLASAATPTLCVGDFKRLEICLSKWRRMKIKAIRIR